MTWLQRFADREAGLRRLGLFRIVVAFMIWNQCAYFVFFKFWNEGFYRAGDRFALSFFDWYPHPPNAITFISIHVVLAICGLLLVFGWHTRPALIVACVLDWYHLFLNQFWHSNNRYFLALVLLVLCFAPVDRSLTWDARRRHLSERGPVWTLWLLRVQLSLIYFASGGGKLLDPDWAGGLVLHRRFAGSIAAWGRHGMPDWLIHYADSSTFWLAASLAAICTELFIGSGLWFPRARRLAIWMGLGFHLFIETTFMVGVFSFLSMGIYLLAVAPGQNDRTLCYDPDRPRHRRLATWLERLDWLERLRLEPAPGPVRARDRDGRWVTGPMAWAVAASATPLLFVFAFPISTLRRLGLGMEEPLSLGQRLAAVAVLTFFAAAGVLIAAPLWMLGSGGFGNLLWGVGIAVACAVHLRLARNRIKGAGESNGALWEKASASTG